MKTITGKTTNNLYSPELDLYSQGINTFHKFPLPSEISSCPVQENNNTNTNTDTDTDTDTDTNTNTNTDTNTDTNHHHHHNHNHDHL